MWSLLLLLLVGTTFAQESGDYAQENSDLLIKAADEDGDIFDKSFDVANDEDECNDKDMSLGQENVHIEPNFTEKAEGAMCPDKGTCGYHVFFDPRRFGKARQACRCRGGNLSSIQNKGSNNNLQSFLRRTCRNISYVWIGVWKQNTCFPYRNIDGSRLDYTNWACGQKRRCGKWCVAMNVHSGQWFTLNCSTQLPFVCTY